MRIYNACLKCAARGSLKYRTQKSPKIRNLITIAQLCRADIFATEACIDNLKKFYSNISSTCSHNMVNFGPLAPEIGLPVWGTPANSNVFRVLASLLDRRRSTEVNQTLHDFGRRLGWNIIDIHLGGSCP